jgi:hypothetical protein
MKITNRIALPLDVILYSRCIASSHHSLLARCYCIETLHIVTKKIYTGKHSIELSVLNQISYDEMIKAAIQSLPKKVLFSLCQSLCLIMSAYLREQDLR